MKTYFSSTALDANYPTHSVVAIGNFDGLHLGHQSILNAARVLGKNLHCPVTVLTFNPHPTLELRPQAPLKLLMTYEEKRAELEKVSVDFCVEEPFNAEFAKTSAHDFFHTILLQRLKARAIVVGENFFFGHKREGTLELLKKYCADAKVELHIQKAINVNGAPVSSSRIREELGRGNLEAAEALQGRPFFYRGVVVHGDKRGRTIGFPTANMECEEKFPLLPGVYATSVFWRGANYQSVTNIGVRPTFQNQNVSESERALIPLKIETHILDQPALMGAAAEGAPASSQTLNLYGEKLEIKFLKRLRDERRFQSVDELKTQIQSDIILARALFQKHT